jgi:hypothetical protein
MYGVLLVLHILLTVSWLGVDAGVFVGSHLIRNRTYDPGARFLVSRLMGYLDLSPRLSVPLLFAVGLSLAYLGRSANVPVSIVWLTWVLALAWCAAIVYTFVLLQRSETGHGLTDRQRTWLATYRRVDLWARWAWLAAIAGALLGGVIGQVVFNTAWLSLKVALFGVVILVGNILRLLPGTSSMALMAQIHRDGSTPEREAVLYARLSRTYPIIVTIYVCVVASVVLGVLKPG